MYGLRASISGHTSDVRCLLSCNFPMGGGFLTGARDKETKYWFPSGEGVGYDMMTNFRGATHWIASLSYMEPDADNINGLIFAGCFDNKIRAYDPLSSEPKSTYSGHGETVCSLAVNNKTQTVVSGSWDKTVKVWKGNWGDTDKKCIRTVSDVHGGSVLALVILEEDGFITGCADKLIRQFDPKGEIVKVFKGHTDVVQALHLTKNDEGLLSAGNDTVIRQWDIETGNCIKEFRGHEGFIYSISVLPRNKGFCSSGEDRSLRVWSWDNAEPEETILLPAQSAWCCTALTMGDIAVGLSDGSVRVFTYRERFQASPEEVAAFETLVSEMKIPAQLQQKGVDVKNLPTQLDAPGTKEGETKMVNEPSGIVAYQWTKGNWEKIGDVTGVNNKETFEGKEYDFIFSIDVEDGRPNLKLPYNLTEDPWRAAQNFIHTNAVSISYLEEVANFIIKNTAAAREERAVQVTEDVGGAADPFTGGSGYKPDYKPKKKMKDLGGAADPFTGASGYRPDTGPNAPRYLPGDAPSGDSSQKLPDDFGANPDRYIPDAESSAPPPAPVEPKIQFVDRQFFPEKTVMQFNDTKPGVDKILKALQDKCAAKNIHIDIEELATLELMTDPSAVILGDDLFVYLVLMCKIGQNYDVIFPLIDILRLGMLNYSVAQYLCGDEKGTDVIRGVLRFLTVDKPAAVPLLAIRVLANMFMHDTSAKLALKHQGEILIRVRESLPIAPKPNQKQAYATLLLNFTIACRAHSADMDIKLNLLDCINTRMVATEGDGKTLIRLLVAFGTLVHQDLTISQAADSLGASESLLQIQNNFKASSETLARNIAGCARKCILEIKKNLSTVAENAMDVDGPSTSGL